MTHLEKHVRLYQAFQLYGKIGLRRCPTRLRCILKPFFQISSNGGRRGEQAPKYITFSVATNDHSAKILKCDAILNCGGDLGRHAFQKGWHNVAQVRDDGHTVMGKVFFKEHMTTRTSKQKR